MGSVHDIDNYDITGDGVKVNTTGVSNSKLALFQSILKIDYLGWHFFQDLIVGKSDGNIEVYAYDDGDDSEPILKYAHVSSYLFLDQFFPLIFSL